MCRGSDAARQKLHESLEWTYKEFVSKVASARRRTYNQIDPLAQGRYGWERKPGRTG